jgi:acyl transferase domain-containing protein
MIGVLAPQKLHEAEPLRRTSVIAAQNGPSHWVLSAREAELPGIEAFLKSQNAAFGRLPVRYAFHSPWLLKDKATAFAQVRAPQARAPHIPVACCAEGGIIRSMGADYFWTTTLEPIRFERTMRQLEAQEGDWRYVDLGPSSTLATLLKYLLPAGSASRFQGVLSPYGREPANIAALAAWRGR